jgi:bifunctional oligoribonuclease and PAP phosphatase NrnA
MLDWKPFVELVQAHRRFLLTTHVRPDGDGLGSMLALGDTLRRRGNEVRLVIASTVPGRYRFLDPEGTIEHCDEQSPPRIDSDLLIVLDTGTWNQLGAFGPALRASPAAKLVIDHHQTQDDLGASRFVDTTAEATGRLVFEAIAALGEKLSEKAANELFVALAMDTGWFRHSNTTPRTFQLASELVEAGAHPDVLYDRLFEDNTLGRMKLMGLVLERLQVVADGKVAYSEIRRTDYAATGALPQETEDMVNFTRSLSGVEVGLFFLEQPIGGVKVSFRSRARVDVARIAERFNGGGHRLASGAVVQAPLEEARRRVLECVIAALDATDRPRR